ncbi:MAG TPA: restriction endonuclease subunit S, partial [Syntrophorhabdaceae bacterium]|nr:restriction endonuclease subunit S [Syntrophorhabdaceae bacterium]
MSNMINGLPTLPNGWLWTTLSEIAEINPGIGVETIPDNLEITFLPMQYVGALTGHIDPSLIKNYQEVKKGYTPFVEGDVLFAKITPCMENGKIAIAKGLKNRIGFGSTEFHVIRLYEDITKQLAYFFLIQENVRKEARSKMTGTAGQLRVPAEFMKQILFPLPPQREQQRIVTKIEELFTRLDAGVEALKKIKAQLKRYRQAVLKYAFEGKLTEKWRETHRNELEPASVLLERIKAERKKQLGNKYKEPDPVDTSDLPELPDGWAWVRLVEVSELKNGINFTSNQKGEKGIPTIDVLNMYSKGINVDTTDLYKVNIDLAEDYLLRYGDILFVRSSVKREGVGWASMFNPTSESVTFCGFIIRARLNSQTILPEFLTYFMRTNTTREKIIGSSSQVTITNINQTSLGNIAFPLTSIAEQQRIVNELEHYFSVADEVEQIVDQSLKRAQRLRQSILKQAFEGKLVPQDPNDEPAEKLLERIKTEKARLEEEKKAKKVTSRKGKKK